MLRFKALFENQRNGKRRWFYINVGDMSESAWGARVTEWLPGVEIDGKWCFEGDICFVYSDFYGDEVKRKAIIKQIRNSFCFDYIDSCFTVSDWSQYHKIEIIGNKWDNPDTDNK